MPRVKLPNGQTASFPDSMSLQEIQSAIESDPNSGALPGVPKAPIPAGLQGPPTPPTPMARVENALTPVADFATGVGKGAAGTFLNLAQGGNYLRELENKVTPNALIPPSISGHSDAENRAYVAGLQNQMQPQGTAQAIGKGVEQAGEFLIPGGAEEATAGRIATMAPKLGRFAAPAARVATGALSTGLVNKVQGGNFGTGALMGAGGGAISEGLRVAAPIVAESALGVRAADRGRGRDAGRMILDETKGFNAGSIAEQAKAKVSGWNTALEQGAANSPMPVDLTPARQISGNAQTAANLRNNPETIKRIGQLSDLLNIEQGVTPNPMRAGAPIKSAAAIPPQVTASRALDLRRGTGELKGSWNPATPNDFADATIGRVYGSLNEGLYQAVPGASVLDRNMSSMIPVAARAGATDLNASALQRILGRFTRPTGALVGSTVGMGAGYKEGGVPGALAGGAIGLVAPEIIGSPTAQMMLARGINKGATPVVRTLLGGGLQADRNSLYKPK